VSPAAGFGEHDGCAADVFMGTVSNKDWGEFAQFKRTCKEAAAVTGRSRTTGG
jgi:hypothetical protein